MDETARRRIIQITEELVAGMVRAGTIDPEDDTALRAAVADCGDRAKAIYFAALEPSVQAGDVWSPSGSAVRYVVRAVGDTDANVYRSGVPISVPLRMFQACDLIERDGAVVARESST